MRNANNEQKSVHTCDLDAGVDADAEEDADGDADASMTQVDKLPTHLYQNLMWTRQNAAGIIFNIRSLG